MSAPVLAAAAIAAGAGLSGATAGPGTSPARVVNTVNAINRASAPVSYRAQLASAASAASSASLLSSSAVAAGRRHHRLGRVREIAWKMMFKRFGWRPRHQFRALNRLWDRESSWNVHAENPYSGAYGIPQAVPGSKMATAGRDWQNSARTQIRWGLRYIRSRYGTPRRAWAHECATGWY